MILAAIAAGCSVVDTEKVEISEAQSPMVLRAGFETLRFAQGDNDGVEAATRTYFDDDLHLFWTAGDLITIFNVGLNEKYAFDGETGENSGTFTFLEMPDETPWTLSRNYAVYPYNELTSINADETINLSLPAVQEYAEGSFGLGANTMVAVTSSTDDTFLPFKNLGGYIVLKLYGSGTVKSVTLSGNNGEKIAGKAVVSASYGSDPVTVMDDSATGTITIDCGDGVTIGSTAADATAFWFVVPPVTFSGGFTFTIIGANGATVTKSTSKSRTITRNVRNSMSAIEVDLGKEMIIFKDADLESALVSAFDSDGDGKLSVQEAEAVTSSSELLKAFGETKTYTSFDEFKYFRNVYFSYSYIPDWFEDWTRLESITIPDQVKELQGTFDGCSALKTVVLPAGLETIGTYVFRNCESLESIVIPESVGIIGKYAFAGCSSLNGITIPDTVTELRYNAFDGCSSLESVSLPSGLESIPENAFSNCSSLKSIALPDGLTAIGGYAFKGCSSLESVSIPSGVTEIPKYAFYECTALNTLTLGAGLTSVGEAAFSYCSTLSNITIPSGVTSIGKWAFRHCTGLSSIILVPTTPPAGGHGMFDDTNDCDIFIPSGTFDSYRLKDAYWSGYYSRLKEGE